MFCSNRMKQAWLGALLLWAFSPVVSSAAEAVSVASTEQAGELAGLSAKEMRRGRLLFMQCRACHALTPGDNGGKIGPSLSGVFGRTAGSAAYYEAYSQALRESGYDWTRETMSLWLTAPSEMVPGTSMVFAGINDEAQRDLLLRYLQIVTQPSAERD